MFFYTKKSAKEEATPENPYWMSFSDMMSGMLFIFILICMALIFQLSKMKDEISNRIKIVDDVNTVRTIILDEIFEELKQKNIDVEISENHTVLRIPERTFYFKTDSHDILPSLQPIAQDIGLAIYNALTKKTASGEPRLNYLDTVFVEGHTDSRRTYKHLKGNWGLSALRAISLWQFWTAQTEYGPQLEHLTNREGKRLFSVSGYAATRQAVKEENTEEDMRKNRRIDIRLTTRQATREELEQTLQPLRREVEKAIAPPEERP